MIASCFTDLQPLQFGNMPALEAKTNREEFKKYFSLEGAAQYFQMFKN